MSLFEEFKSFIARGNAIDLAVGVVLGTAFGKIVSSVVDGVLMPPIGLLIGKVNFKDLVMVLKPEEKLADGTVSPAVSILYGQFLQSVIDFLLIGLCVFILVKAINALRRQPEPAVEAAPPPEDVKLLTEIRDILKQK